MNKFIKKITLLCVSLSGLAVYAQLDGSVSYEKFQRLNDPAKKSEYDDWAQIEGNYETRAWNGKVYGEFAARAYVTKEPAFNFSMPEAYIEFKDEDNRISVGRQLLRWNENEDYWLLSTLNPNQGFYLLSEKKEGLVGIQYDHKFNKNLNFSVFFSYFFVPGMNPGLEIENGSVSSKSEWVRLPPKYTVLEGNVLPLYYTIDMPNIYNDVVKNKSLGFRLSGTNEEKSSELSAFFIYKPQNSLQMNADARFDQDRDVIAVDASPVVNHHLYYGIQYKQQLGDVQMVAGVDMSDPTATFGNDFKVVDFSREENKKFESEYFNIEPNYERESYASLSFNVNQGYYMFSLNYINLLTNNERGSDDFFSDTAKWSNALGMRGRYYFNDFINVMGDLKYDFDRDDIILKAEATYAFWRGAASLNLGAELIKSPNKNSYWSAYRANDTIYSSLKFAF
ncbi:hypothetical protein ABMA79_02275 [Halobacteriovorax sp. HFRX-2_2]|uniref:hypothetical protein n=1 Tax=unclassified Halobacteriovorax TaxID=2639665 RepID=UPI003715C48B